MSGSGSASRRWDIEDRNGMRVVYGSCGLPLQIRTFRPNAKIGDPADSIDLIYDDCYNLINTLRTIPVTSVNNLDIRVPEKPVITGSTPASPNASKSPTIEGTITGDMVKDGDVIEIYTVLGNKILGSGNVLSNSFSVQIDLTNYSSGDAIEVYAKAFNEKKQYHGGSERSFELIYTIS